VEAVKWFRKAAEQNFAVAQYNLGVCYEQGVAKDEREELFPVLGGEPVEAVKWYRKAAEQNDVNAQFNLGMCLRTGRPGDGGLGRGLQVAVAGSEARP
jgi:uncharacterized protein